MISTPYSFAFSATILHLALFAPLHESEAEIFPSSSTGQPLPPTNTEPKCNSLIFV